MPDPSAGEIGGIFAGIVALFASIGGGISWLAGWKDRREETRAAKLDAWQRELSDREDKIATAQREYQESIEKRLVALVKWASRMQTKYSALWNGYQQISTELRHKEPDNAALARADEMLRIAMPLDPNIPHDLAELLAEHDDDDEIAP